MPRPGAAQSDAQATTGAGPQRHRWLLLVHQLPSTPSNLRVRTWRRLQQLGAVAVKQSVYVLPDTPASREDFEWLKTEIEGAGGQAVVFAANTVDTWSDDELVEEFRHARQAMYGELAKQIEQELRAVARAASGKGGAARTRGSLVENLRERFAAIERIDFFGSAGRDRVVTLLDQLDRQAAGRKRASAAPIPESQSGRRSYHGGVWVTRPRPGVDRMASAWLIRRFIDRKATFDFAADASKAPADAIAFDMFGVELTHRGELCTFEVLVQTFGLETPAIARIAAIVHDLDLKDGRFAAPEASVVSSLIDGLQLAHADDHVLLEQGMAMFEALHQSFAQTVRLSGPRPVSTRRKRSRR